MSVARTSDSPRATGLVVLNARAGDLSPDGGGNGTGFAPMLWKLAQTRQLLR